MPVIHQRARFQPGDQEHQAFDQIDQQVPEEDALQPRGRGDQPRPVPAHVEPAGDGRQHAGAAEMRRHPEGEIGRHQRQRDLHPRVARPLPQAQAQPADARCHRRSRRPRSAPKVPAGLFDRERAGGDRGHGEAVEDQRGGVVGEPFAFQHHHNPARQAESLCDGERRHRVRRCDDGAEHEADRPGKMQQIMRGRRHRAGGEHHAAEGEQADRPQIELELAPAHGNAGRIDQRRQDDEQHHFRRQRHFRQARDQRHGDAGDHQQDRRRHVQPPRQHRDHGQHRQHEQQRLHDRGHGLTTAFPFVTLWRCARCAHPPPSAPCTKFDTKFTVSARRSD